MKETTLHIKNMVCDRCTMTVQRILEELGFHVQEIDLGKAVIRPQPDSAELKSIDRKLQEVGFERVLDRKKEITVAIKSALITYMDLPAEPGPAPRVSDYLSSRLHRSYATLSRYFSSCEGQTIERYFIELKVERIKEWLTYGEMTLSEMAWRLRYSSVQHISSQFRSVTGMSVTEYRKLQKKERKKLDSLGRISQDNGMS